MAKVDPEWAVQALGSASLIGTGAAYAALSKGVSSIPRIGPRCPVPALSRQL